MKRILGILVLITAFYSCENLEDNTPALQLTVDQEFIEAIDARATENEDGSFLIQGITRVESLTLRIPSGTPGEYNLGGTSPNYATFENALGDAYTTNPDGSGRVIITNWDTSAKTLSGTFKFNAVLPERDTLFVQEGVFFQVPYGGLESIDDDTPPNAGTFVARVDGVTFNPFTITAVGTANAIIITGSNTSRTITLRVPNDVLMGGYEIPQSGFDASYMDSVIDESADLGNFTIFEHDMERRTIKGTFSFLTANKTISQGQFNVTYE